MDEDGAVDRTCCPQIAEELKRRREKGFFFSNISRTQNTVNSVFKRSNFLTLSAIKKWNYFIGSMFFFNTKSLN